MKRTNRATVFISLILFLFLAVYFGASLIRSAQNPLQTTLAVSMQTEEGFFAPGIIIRDESVVTAPQTVVTSLVREGERVSVGMSYLSVYASEADRELAMRRTQLQREMEQLEARLSTDGEVNQSTGIEAEIRRGLRELSFSVQGGDLTNLEAQTVSLRTLALAGDRAGLQNRIEILREELAHLGDLSEPAHAIQAESAGTYSTRVDGFEHLALADADKVSVSDLQALFERNTDPYEIPNSVGKLVRGSTWYYLALVPETEFAALDARLNGDLPNRVLVSISGMSTSEIAMRIRSLSEIQGGYAVAVLESNIALVETLGLRHGEARIVFHTFSGIRVPAEALRWTEPDGETGAQFPHVFTLTVGMAEQKFVTIVYAGEGYYLVEPDTLRTSAESSLREGNTIIIRGGVLYDGRILG